MKAKTGLLCGVVLVAACSLTENAKRGFHGRASDTHCGEGEYYSAAAGRCAPSPQVIAPENLKYASFLDAPLEARCEAFTDFVTAAVKKGLPSWQLKEVNCALAFNQQALYIFTVAATIGSQNTRQNLWVTLGDYPKVTEVNWTESAEGSSGSWSTKDPHHQDWGQSRIFALDEHYPDLVLSMFEYVNKTPTAAQETILGRSHVDFVKEMIPEIEAKGLSLRPKDGGQPLAERLRVKFAPAADNALQGTLTVTDAIAPETMKQITLLEDVPSAKLLTETFRYAFAAGALVVRCPASYNPCAFESWGLPLDE